MKPIRQLISFPNYLHALLFCLCGCVSSANHTNTLHVGMTKPEAITAMRQQPRSVSAIGELQILHFTIAPRGALIGDPEPFVIYVQENSVIAFGHPASFAQDPTIIHRHIISGGQTNKTVMEYQTPQPAPAPAARKKGDTRT
jgi:hypothetical protein